MFQRRKSVIAQQETTEGQQRLAEQDFWRRTLRKQRNLNFFTFFGVLAAFAAFLVLRNTLHESQKATGYARQQAESAVSQARTAQQEFELSERPWISAEINIREQLHFYPDGHGAIQLIAVLHNSGHSVALDIAFHNVIIPPTTGIASFESEIAKACEPLRHRESAILGRVVFPSDSSVTTDSAGMSVDDVKKAVAQEEWLVHTSEISPSLISCIDYRFPFGKQHHQTRYLFTLGIPTGAGMWRGFEARGTPAGIVLIPNGVNAD